MNKKVILRETLILLGFVLLGVVSFLFGFHFRTLYQDSSIGDMLGTMGGVGFLFAAAGYPLYIIGRFIVWVIKKPWASKLTGIKVIGYIQGILGGLGTMTALFILIGSLCVGFFAEGEKQMGALAITALPLFIPFPLILIPGLGVLSLRPWARMMQIVMGYIVLAVSALIWFFMITQQNWLAVLSLSVVMFASGFLVYYFSHPKVRRQFL